MKKIFILLLTMSLINLSFTDGDNPPPAEEEEKEEIKLTGNIKPQAPPKGGASLILAFIDGDAIEIEFLSNFPNLVITIENHLGVVVYLNTVNVAAGAIYPIDISSLAAGTYLLKIADANGGSLSGYFNI